MKQAQGLLLATGSRNSNFMCLFIMIAKCRQDDYEGICNGNK